MTLTRRELLVQGAAAAAALRFVVTDSLLAAEPSKYAAAFQAIDAMAERYLREMNAPGMTLVIADRSGTLRVVTYGLADLDRKEPVRPDHLFQIGSISKSFVGLALLQLRDEGKLDLHAPVTRYLPGLRIEPRNAITVHHLLTHSSGLAAWNMFPSDPDARHVAGFTPGSNFWYCNAAYAMLGLLIEAVGGRGFPDAIRTRVFEPLGMNGSIAYIAPDSRPRAANSYIPWQADRPYPRMERLAEAAQIVMDNAAGSISSTPADMGAYLRMIANRGKGLLSPASFDDWVKGYVPTDPSGAESYGYGWFTGKLDDHTMIRHTGGMVSFMSAMHVDLVDGIGAFASINAQLGYRPNPVTTYAIRAVRAVNEGKAIPEPPPINPPSKIADADKLAGVYTSIDGDRIEFVAEGDGLVFVRGGKRHPVETAGGLPVVRAPQMELFGFVFEREKDGPATSVGHGARLWMREPRRYSHPEEWNAFAGHYHNDSPWMGSTRVVARQGRLWLDGATPLRQVDANTFRIAEPEHCPEWVQFLDVVAGKSRHIKVSGESFWRVDVP